MQAFAHVCLDHTPAAVCLSQSGTFRGHVTDIWLQDVRFVSYPDDDQIPPDVHVPNEAVYAWLEGQIVDTPAATPVLPVTPVIFDHITPETPFRATVLQDRPIVRADFVHYRRGGGGKFLLAYGAR